MSDNNNLKNSINNFLTDEEKQRQSQQTNMDCSSGVCVIKGDKSLVERINKKIITEDGRELLM
jgi:NADH:ubiquinone oxidoreductase subunit E